MSLGYVSYCVESGIITLVERSAVRADNLTPKVDAILELKSAKCLLSALTTPLRSASDLLSIAYAEFPKKSEFNRSESQIF
jgi:hypothetical protein